MLTWFLPRKLGGHMHHILDIDFGAFGHACQRIQIECTSIARRRVAA